MSADLLRFVGTGLFFVFIFVSGFWLSRSGKPYNPFFFNVHKFIVLGAVVFLILTLIAVSRTAPLDALAWTVAGVTGLFWLGLIVSGGLLSAVETPPGAIQTLHHVIPYLALLSTAGTLYLVLPR